jgi:low affinity Fe/Cu permease
MYTGNWLVFASDVITVCFSAAVTTILLNASWHKRQSSTTRALVLFAVLTLVCSIPRIFGSQSYFELPILIKSVAIIAFTTAFVVLSLQLMRIIPNAIAFRDLEQLSVAAEDLRHSQERLERAAASSASGGGSGTPKPTRSGFPAALKNCLATATTRCATSFRLSSPHCALTTSCKHSQF